MRKGFAPIVIIVLVLAVLVFIGIVAYKFKSKSIELGQKPTVFDQSGVNQTPSLLPNSGKLDKFSLWTGKTQLRGANIYQRRVYVELDGTEYMGNGPLGPPLSQNDFDSLAKAGANLVVLSHPGLFDEKPPYVLNKSIQDNLDKLIDMARKADLFVVIATRTGPGRSEFTLLREGVGTWFDKSYLNDDVWKDKSAQEAYSAMWKYTAERYRNNPAVVGYELMVEPNADELLSTGDPKEFYSKYGNSSYDWNVLASQISSAIRQVDKETPILIGGLHYSGVRWLPYLKLTGDKRIVYTAHQYEPQSQYTHQSEDGKAPLINSYPGKFDTDEDGVVRDFNKAWIDSLLTAVDNFKNTNSVSVAVTEYGIVRWEPGADTFMNDEMELFEKRGVNYAVWEWSASYKPLTDENNAFNFRFGPNSNIKTNTDSKLYQTIKNYWQRNKIRPSSFSNS